MYTLPEEQLHFLVTHSRERVPHSGKSVITGVLDLHILDFSVGFFSTQFFCKFSVLGLLPRLDGRATHRHEPFLLAYQSRPNLMGLTFRGMGRVIERASPPPNLIAIIDLLIYCDL